MRVSILLKAKSDGGYSGCCLEVRFSHHYVSTKANWVLAADKSMSILLGRPICLRDEDCTVHFPRELDDE